jgi:predicted aspartyl protease
VEVKGKITESFESVITIEIVTEFGFEEVEVVIDTGFDGDLVLPKSIVSRLNLIFYFRLGLIWSANRIKK